MTYSTDLREKVLQFVEKCGSITEGARLFGISKPTIYNWLKLKEKEGSLAAKRPKRPWRKIIPSVLMVLLEKHPDWTLKEYGEYFGMTQPSVSNAFARLKITRKKRLCATKNGTKKSVHYFWSR